MYTHDEQASGRRAGRPRAGYQAVAPAVPAGTRSGPTTRVPGQRSRSPRATGGQRGTAGQRSSGGQRNTGGQRGAGARPRAGDARRTTPRRGGSQLTVAPPAPVAVPRTAFVVLVLVVVAAGVIGVLLLNTKVNQNAFVLDDLRRTQSELDQQEQELEQRIAHAKSPAQLAEAARRMGLVQAEEVAYLRLPDGEVLHEPVPDLPVPGPTDGSGPTDGDDPGAEG